MCCYGRYPWSDLCLPCDLQVDVSLQLMQAPFVLLKMCYLLPLLEMVDTLQVFAQKQDVFVSHFVTTLKMTKGQLYSLYVNKATSFTFDEL
jgi:hypothetical protein